MRYLKYWVVIGLSLLCAMENIAQNNLPICTSRADIKAHSGQRVLVFGHRATHYGLPHQPYILLLEKNEWIFLGNENFYQGKQYQNSYLLIEGVISPTNQGFELSKFSSKNSFPYPQRPPEKEPEKTIRNHPVFTKVHQIQGIPICHNSEDLSKNLNRWVLIYGLFSQKNDQTLYFQSGQESPGFQLEVNAYNHRLKNDLRPGLVIARFDQVNAPPAKVLHWQLLPFCTTEAEVAAHAGEIIAVKGKMVGKGKKHQKFPFLEMADQTYIYFSDYPKNFKSSPKTKNKPLFVIARVLNKDVFFDFTPSVFLPGYTHTYFKNIYWYGY
ncbi:MAG TPA: hypothetical protein DCS93_38020 [Microscillaceae bacterium]|nr:hypothetical protein [Microscillaceae bacterium]